MRTQLETLGGDFKQLKISDGENLLYFESWTMRYIGIVRTMATLAHFFCLRVVG